MVSQRETWVEAFGVQVRELDAVLDIITGYALAYGGRHSVRQGLSIWMGYDDKAVHELNPACNGKGATTAPAKLRKVTYHW